MSNLMKEITGHIQRNKIMIFSKSTCPYCIKVKELFTSMGVEFFALELDKLPNGDEMQKTLASKSGRSTVPQVFIKTKFIGGCDDTLAVHQRGNLHKLIED